MAATMTHPPRTLTAAEEMRLTLGFIVQPFVTAAVAFLLFPFLLLDQDGRTFAGGYASDVTDAAVSMASGTFMAAIAVLAAAVPTAVWVLKRRVLNLSQCLIYGAAFGCLPIVIGTVLGGSYGLTATLRSGLFASLVGTAGAAAFWAISVRGRDFSRDPN